MREADLDLLRCPITLAPLRLRAAETGFFGEITTGELLSPEGRLYPIFRGVPRFVPKESYAASFGFEWHRWPRLQFDSENIGKPFEGHSSRMWELVTGLAGVSLAGQVVVDFGCGPGRFLEVVRGRGARAVGIDMSQAVESAQANFAADPNVLIVQADINKPPLKPGSFHGGFSIGVLHHTPRPAGGLKALITVVREGGWVACSVYPNRGFYSFPAVSRWRRLTRAARPALGYSPALAYSWLSATLLAPTMSVLRRIRGVRRVVRWLEHQVLPTLYLPDRRWRYLDMFDAITPEIATTHSSGEVLGWMEAGGCTGARVMPWSPTSVAGVKGHPPTGVKAANAALP